MNKDLDLAQIDKLNNNITLLTIEKEKLESKNKELSNKLSKKDKEIISLITTNNKEKKNINEQYKNQTERLRNEVEDRRKMNDKYKDQISELQKKIFQMQNSDYDNDINESMNNNYNNDRNILSMSVGQSNDINLLSPKNLISNNKFTNLTINSVSTLVIEQNYKPKFTPRSNRSNRSNRSKKETPSSAKKVIKKISGEIKEDAEDDSEEYYDDETDEEFNEKMKKLNQKNPNDTEEMKLYKKENRKMLYRLEDALDQINELKQKMIKIEQIVNQKQNELYNSLKNYFKILIDDFNITNKNRESLNEFLKLVNYSDDEINNLLSKKQKGLLGFFK